MNLQSLARALLTAFCAVQGLATVVMDINRTHAAHPRWLGHARFHVVWQTGTVAALAAIECWLLWLNGPMQTERFYLAALLAVAPIFGFFVALVSRPLYGGALSDPGGIPPLRLRLRARTFNIDMNLVAEIAGLLTVAGIVELYRAAL